MKHLFLFVQILVTALIFSGCKCNGDYKVTLKDHYPTQNEFRSALVRVDSLVRANNIVAYLDTLPDGKPNREGRTSPLSEYVHGILSQIDSGKIEPAIHDVFHFDGTPFSLISYLMKAEMAGDITPATLVQIAGEIPLPPLPVPDYTPPLVPVPGEVIPPPRCPCDPKVKIKVTWKYGPTCGNYLKRTTEYTHMPRGTIFRLDAEVDNCGEGGTWTNQVSMIGITAYGINNNGGNGNTVVLMSESAGTIEITFKYQCNCGCGKSDWKMFKINFD